MFSSGDKPLEHRQPAMSLEWLDLHSIRMNTECLVASHLRRKRNIAFIS